jgi:hypothetical protein
VVVSKVWAGLVQVAIPFLVGHGSVDSVEVEACAAGGVYIGLAPREGRKLESLEALVREDDHLSLHKPIYMLHLMVHTMPSASPAARVISVSKREARPATTETPRRGIRPIHSLARCNVTCEVRN